MSDDLLQTLHEAIATRRSAQEMKAQIDRTIDQANDDITMAMLALEMRSTEWQGAQVALIGNTPRARFDKDRMKQALVEAGVRASVVGDAIKKATVKGKSPEKEWSVRMTIPDLS